MGWCQGGIIFEGELRKLRADLDAYYGYRNEVEEMGVQRKKVVPKPHALKSLEQCEAFGVLPQAGGLDDQSYIWLQAVAECRKVRNLMLFIRNKNKQLAESLNNPM